MTRISFGEYRSGVRQPSFRAVPGRAGPSYPTTTPFQWGAIARHHGQSPQAAREYLVERIRTSPYWGPGGTPQHQGQAETTLRSYDNYASMTSNDERPVIATGLTRDLEIPPNVLGVRTDVLLLDPAGYVPRLVLWDTNDLTPELAILYAAPLLLAAEDELGEGRVAHIEVFHVRSATQMIVPAGDARAAQLNMEATVARILSG